MSYIVLARRLRPKTLDDVVGQSLVTQAIQNALSSNTLHPVYLLTGTRGVGKTTIARIIAKSLNCEVSTTTPCLTCDSCQMIQDGRFPDLYEIDAASRTKVEDTREVLEQVQYMPQMGKKKVYLIDEVHMLSQHSFNALLKTLEEPPQHVQFILATTEPHKIPKTILSRCLHFNLQPLTENEIDQHLQQILTSDKVPFEPQATLQIAQAAEGSMRDALSLLDQCLAISPSQISGTTTSQLLSTLPQEKIQDILKAIHSRDIDQIEALCDEVARNNIDFRTLLKQLAEALIYISIDQVRGKETPLTNLWPETYVQVLYRMLMQGMGDLEHSPSIKLGALMCLIRMAAFSPQEADSLPKPTVATAKPSQTATPQAKAPQKAKTAPAPQMHDWSTMIGQLDLTPMLKSLAENCTLEQLSQQHWRLLLNSTHKHLLSERSLDKLQTEISQLMGLKIKLEIILSEDNSQTPAAIKEADQNKATQQARAELGDDPVLSQLLAEFNVAKTDVEVEAAKS